MLARLVSALIGLLLATLPATADAPNCEAIDELTRYYATLAEVHAAGGLVQPDQDRRLQDFHARFDRASVTHLLHDTAIATHAEDILRGLALTPTRRPVDPPNLAYFSPIMATTGVGHRLETGLALLGRLPCAQPLGQQNQDGYETALPRSANGVAPGEPMPAIWQISLISVLLCAICATVIVWRILGRRRVRLRRRYICNVPVTYSSLDLPGAAYRSCIRDISRAGCKIEGTDAYRPEVGTRLRIRLPLGVFLLRVTWANEHYFGGLFGKKIGAGELRALLRRR